jgi:teichuronic acid biosynthesis glycosyltransferase TuaG
LMSNDIKRTITFSVVIPAFNASKTIVRAISSCIEQSYPPYEIIVVDDASTDDTAAILDQFTGQIRKIILTKNSGSSIARNKGMDTATGNYIAFLDADDEWHKHKLLIMASALEANKNIQFLYHSFSLNEFTNQELPEKSVLYRLPFIKLLYGNPIATPCAVISNQKKFRFETSMRHMEDYDLWLRIGYKHKIFFIDLPLCRISRPVLSHGGVSAAKWKMRKGELRAFRRLIRLNPLFIFAQPFLYCYSIGKHIYKAISGR